MPIYRFLSNSVLQVEALHQLLQEGLLSGEVRPLPLTTFSHAQAEEAFRYMAKGILSMLPYFNHLAPPFPPSDLISLHIIFWCLSNEPSTKTALQVYILESHP